MGGRLMMGANWLSQILYKDLMSCINWVVKTKTKQNEKKKKKEINPTTKAKKTDYISI